MFAFRRQLAPQAESSGITFNLTSALKESLLSASPVELIAGLKKYFADLSSTP